MIDILFWSGGKDAFLAYEFYRQENPDEELVLLTTYNEKNEIVPHQNIPLKNIEAQARALDLSLLLVSLPDECPNEVYLKKVHETLKTQDQEIGHLVFGDWHLQDIRNWREEQFNELGYNCLFPIWNKDLNELLPILLFKPVEVRISAVAEEYHKWIRVGELFNQKFIRQLPKEIDPMGEKGEFHTEVVFKSFGDEHKPVDQPFPFTLFE